jgi:hypothetical protein
MGNLTTRAELADAIGRMRFRDLVLFGEDLMNITDGTLPASGIEWARLLSDWSEAAADYETEEAEEAREAAKAA